MRIWKDALHEFNSWTLGRQMQVLFTFFGSLICLIMIIITKFQLDWLKTEVIAGTKLTVDENILRHMQSLGKIHSVHIEVELANFLYLNSHLLETDKFLNSYNQTQIFQVSSSLEDSSGIKSTELDYTTSAYYSRTNPLDPEGSSQLQIESQFQLFYPNLCTDLVTGFFQGYEADELFVFYPATAMKNSYTPLNAEWYYNAAKDTTKFNITQPYRSNTGGWVSAFSKALVVNSSFLGVSALNVSLDHIIEVLDSVNISNDGFALLIAKEGVLLNTPDVWENVSTSSYPRVFLESKFGISQSMWDSFGSTPDGQEYEFYDYNGTGYRSVKYSIKNEYLGVTHYLLVCLQILTIEEYQNSKMRQFSSVYLSLFWTILAIGIATFAIGLLLILYVSRSSALQLRLIQGMFQNLLKRALMLKLTSRTDLNFLNEFNRTFTTLYEACQIKLNRLEEVESGFVSHAWNYRKPGDLFLYTGWENSLYPYNYFTGKSFQWREVVTKLKSQQ